MGVGQFIGEAAVAIIADAKGFAQDVRQQTSGPLNQVADDLAQSFGDVFKAGMGSVAAAAGAGLAAAFTKGFQRLKVIDQAEHQMRALGLATAEVESAMSSANKAVLGTQFGLDEAAQAAARLSVAGVDMGAEMDRSLSVIASMAALSGTSMMDITDIMAEAAAQGKITGDTIWQLTQRNIPALDFLADAFGVTNAEMSKMVSEGLVSFEEFSVVMEERVGGAADVMGQSFGAMAANVMAAMGRVGAAALQNFLPAMKESMQGTIEWLNSLKPAAEAMGDAMMQIAAVAMPPLVLSMKFFVETIIAAVTWIGENIKWLTILGGTIVALVAGYKAYQAVLAVVKIAQGAYLAVMILTTGQLNKQARAEFLAGLATTEHSVVVKIATAANFVYSASINKATLALKKFTKAALTNPFTWIAVAAIAAAAAIAWFFTQTETGIAIIAGLKEAFDKVVAAIGPLIEAFKDTAIQIFTTAMQILVPIAEAAFSVLQRLGEILTTVFAPILAILGPALSAIADQFSNISTSAEGFAAITDIIGQVLSGIIASAPIIVQALVDIVIALIGVFVQMLPVFIQGAVTLFMGMVTAITTALPAIITGFVNLILQIVAYIPTVLPMLIAGAIQLFMGLVQGLIAVVGPLLAALGQVIQAVIGAILANLPVLLEAALQLFMMIVAAVPLIIAELVTAILSLLPVIIEAVLQMLPPLLAAGVELFLAIVQAIPKIIGPLISAILALLPHIVSSVIGMLPELIAAAVKLFLGIVKAVPQIVGELVAALVALGPKMFNALKSLIPKMIDAGRDLIRGVVQGVKDAAGELIDAVVNIAKNAVDSFKSFLKIGSPSKLMEGFGKDTMQGYINGVAALSKAVSSSVLRPIANITTGAGAPGGVPMIAAAGPSPVTVAGGNTVTFGPGSIVQNGVQDADRAAVGMVNRIAERVTL